MQSKRKVCQIRGQAMSCKFSKVVHTVIRSVLPWLYIPYSLLHNEHELLFLYKNIHIHSLVGIYMKVNRTTRKTLYNCIQWKLDISEHFIIVKRHHGYTYRISGCRTMVIHTSFLYVEPWGNAIFLQTHTHLQ